MNIQEWREELDFVRKISDAYIYEGSVDSAFNSDPACMRQYLEMQAETARRMGHAYIAAGIRFHAEQVQHKLDNLTPNQIFIRSFTRITGA